jgi:hypothetical protein
MTGFMPPPSCVLSSPPSAAAPLAASSSGVRLSAAGCGMAITERLSTPKQQKQQHADEPHAATRCLLTSTLAGEGRPEKPAESSESQMADRRRLLVG